MRKLKVYVPQDGPYGLVPQEGGAPVEEETCYLKSEADELIEALNRQIKFLQVTNSSKCYQCNKCADGMGKVFDETLYELKEQKKYILEHTTDVINSQEVEIRRQKYKRCLAMARWCKVEQTYSSFSIYCTEHPASRWAKKNVLVGSWFVFWKNREKRWLKIAKQFKEAK